MTNKELNRLVPFSPKCNALFIKGFKYNGRFVRLYHKDITKDFHTYTIISVSNLIDLYPFKINLFSKEPGYIKELKSMFKEFLNDPSERHLAEKALEEKLYQKKRYEVFKEEEERNRTAAILKYRTQIFELFHSDKELKKEEILRRIEKFEFNQGNEEVFNIWMKYRLIEKIEEPKYLKSHEERYSQSNLHLRNNSILKIGYWLRSYQNMEGISNYDNWLKENGIELIEPVLDEIKKHTLTQKEIEEKQEKDFAFEKKWLRPIAGSELSLIFSNKNESLDRQELITRIKTKSTERLHHILQKNIVESLIKHNLITLTDKGYSLTKLGRDLIDKHHEKMDNIDDSGFDNFDMD